MVTRGKPAARRTTAKKPATTARRASTTKKPATTSRRAPAKPAAKAKAAPDVTVYADKPPTGYHRAFAKYIVQEIGYDPNEASSKRAAFLAGVSIATAARPVFQNSEFLAEWREETGEAKRGPKTADQKRRAQREVVSDDEFEDDDDEFDDEESEEDDDEFDEEESDEFDEDEEDSEDDDDFEDEEEEETPPKRTTRRTPAKKPAASARKAPARRGRTSKPADDDEDLF